MVCETVWYIEKHMVCWYWHSTVRYMYYMAEYCLVVWRVSVYKVRKSRIRRTKIICNDVLERSLECTKSWKIKGMRADGQTNRHTDL